MYFKAQFKKINTWYGKYQRLWNCDFSINNEKEVLSNYYTITELYKYPLATELVQSFFFSII